MAKKMTFNKEGQPMCPKCGSTTFRNKSVLEWGRATQACAGCGIGLLPASRGDIRKARKLNN